MKFQQLICDPNLFFCIHYRYQHAFYISFKQNKKSNFSRASTQSTLFKTNSAATQILILIKFLVKHSYQALSFSYKIDGKIPESGAPIRGYIEVILFSLPTCSRYLLATYIKASQGEIIFATAYLLGAVMFGHCWYNKYT